LGYNVLAYDFPLLSLFWSMVILFLWIAWFLLLFKIVTDIFRDRTMGGVAKAIWLIVLVFLPFLGTLVYVVARGDSMAERDAAQVRAADEAFQAYVRNVADPAGSSISELERLASLKERGVLTEEEFAAQKAKLLAQ
jgi:hypothetical protein